MSLHNYKCVVPHRECVLGLTGSKAIVHGDPPVLPDGYSATAQDWVARCLIKQPESRASYHELLVRVFSHSRPDRGDIGACGRLRGRQDFLARLTASMLASKLQLQFLTLSAPMTNARYQEHPFLQDEETRDVDIASWTVRAVAWKIEQRQKERDESLSKDARPTE